MKSKKVLVLDDHKEILLLLKKQIESQGHKVYTFERADDALEFLIENPTDIDIVISDVMIPVMDGMDFVHEIKHSELLKNIPVVFISAMSDDYLKEHTAKLGAEDFLTKPIQAEALFEKINMYSR